MCTTLTRYLVRLKYLGTGFTGIARIISRDRIIECGSIQAKLESALSELRIKIPAEIKISSRTDAGVHALNTSIHVDILTEGSRVYNPDYLTRLINDYSYSNKLSIFVIKTIKVPFTFNARFSATSRTYLYRIAILRSLEKHQHISSALPIEEWKKCHLIYDPLFDVEKLKSGAKLFEGTHDFESFKKIAKDRATRPHYRRTIYSVDVKPGKQLSILDEDNDIEFINIFIHGKGFLHNQVRRMVGSLCALARGRITNEDIVTMLQVPNKNSWSDKVNKVPADGLYLCNVEYNLEDLIFKEEEEKEK